MPFSGVPSFRKKPPRKPGLWPSGGHGEEGHHAAARFDDCGRGSRSSYGHAASEGRRPVVCSQLTFKFLLCPTSTMQSAPVDFFDDLATPRLRQLLTELFCNLCNLGSFYSTLNIERNFRAAAFGQHLRRRSCASTKWLSAPSVPSNTTSWWPTRSRAQSETGSGGLVFWGLEVSFLLGRVGCQFFLFSSDVCIICMVFGGEWRSTFF